jgi:hypothetical protein
MAQFLQLVSQRYPVLSIEVTLGGFFGQKRALCGRAVATEDLSQQGPIRGQFCAEFFVISSKLD